MRKRIAFLCGCFCVAVIFVVLATPEPKVHHAGSSAFTAALDAAVTRLEHGGRAVTGATAVVMNATAPAVVAQGTQTYDAYTCEAATCDTYNPQVPTCDAQNPACRPPGGVHTTEPPPYNHTCEGQTCDGSFTCDFTADPRAPTCDAARTDCIHETFNAYVPTCDPLRPECRGNNPGACTVQATYPTCSGAACPPPTSDPRSVTCDAHCGPTTDPGQPTCDPAGPTCSPTQPTCDAGITCNMQYTCQFPTCETYDPQAPTCDRASPLCAGQGHTTEPPPYNHTCDSQTCDGSFTCDITADPRALTCDAANTACMRTTFNAFDLTCNPMLPECRTNNPMHCTSQIYETCQHGNPNCPSVGVQGTTWGKVKEEYKKK